MKICFLNYHDTILNSILLDLVLELLRIKRMSMEEESFKY